MSLQPFVYAPETWQQNLINSTLSWSAKHSNFTPWIAQTYAELALVGIDFKITETLAVDGIVLADRDTLGNSYPFLSRTILICAKSDREFHPSAHFHISHNRQDESGFINNKVWQARYVPHWLIPGIESRDFKRGTKLENIAYIGTRGQLAEELKSPEWARKIGDLGLNWLPIFEPDLWNNYTNIDLIVAARRFPSPPYPNKGAIKLFNCWRAGVPALLAPESAFMAERISEYDFLPINSIEDTYSKILFLKTNPEVYSNMLKRCYERSKTNDSESIRNKWLKVFEEAEIFYAYWNKVPDLQKKTAFLLKRYLLKQERLYYKIIGEV